MAKPSLPASFQILPATRLDLETLAHISDICIRQDASFYEYYNRFSMNGNSVYQETLARMRDTFDDPTQFLFKAVVYDDGGVLDGSGSTGGSGVHSGSVPPDGRTERIVGYTHWRVGYIEIPKVDPFVKRNERVNEQVAVDDVVETGVELARVDDDPRGDGDKVIVEMDDTLLAGRKFMQDTRTIYWNTLISRIRGKKYIHLTRIMVHPDRQNRGIASMLMKWGIELADREKILVWVNARPAGMGLYRKCGFEEVGIVDDYTGDFVVQPTTMMWRKPKPMRETD